MAQNHKYGPVGEASQAGGGAGKLPLPVKVAMAVCALLLGILAMNQFSGDSDVAPASSLGDGPDSATEQDVGVDADFGETGGKQFFPNPKGDGAVTPGKSAYTIEQVEEMNRKLEAMAEDVIARISKGPPKCLPKICTDDYHFRDPARTAGKKVGLTSIPGSGNTWVRSVVRAGTRLYTGSVYRDGNLKKNGFLGEPLPPDDPRTAVVKSHYGFHYGGAPWAWGDANIHIVRAPFDAFLAECNRQSGGHTGVTKKETKLVSKCSHFAMHKLGRIKNMFNVWEKESADELRTRQGPSVHVHLEEAHKMPVATVFYEDMANDFTRATAYLLSFLKVFFEDEQDWPDVYDGLVCALHEGQVQEKMHRTAKAPPPQELFRNPDDSPNEIALAVCKKVDHIWNKKKWGKCNGYFQKERKVKKHKRMHDIPENVCGPGESADGSVDAGADANADANADPDNGNE